MNNCISILLIFTCLCLSCCNSNHSQTSVEIREGDLLFQNLDCGELCDAIEAVTEGVNGKDFSHCALVVKIDDTLKVVEAIGRKVQETTLLNFFTRSADTGTIKNITIARVKPEYLSLVSEASSYARKQIGQPYDDEFLMDNGKWYCSELIYHAFKEANSRNDFFNLNEMTFLNPKTNQYFDAWVNYYKELNKPIPEGMQGINPGIISRSDKLTILELDRIKWN